jgi:hypothetical protein
MERRRASGACPKVTRCPVVCTAEPEAWARGSGLGGSRRRREPSPLGRGTSCGRWATFSLLSASHRGATRMLLLSGSWAQPSGAGLAIGGVVLPLQPRPLHRVVDVADGGWRRRIALLGRGCLDTEDMLAVGARCGARRLEEMAGRKYPLIRTWSPWAATVANG